LDIVPDDGAGADDGARAEGDAVENLRACPEPRAVANRNPLRTSRLFEHRLRRIRKVVIAADHIDVGRQQHVGADADPAGGKDLAVETDVRAIGELDVAVLAGQDRIAADEDAVADPDAGVRLALGVEQTVVVDHDVVADVNLVRMPQYNVL